MKRRMIQVHKVSKEYLKFLENNRDSRYSDWINVYNDSKYSSEIFDGFDVKAPEGPMINFLEWCALNCQDKWCMIYDTHDGEFTRTYVRFKTEHDAVHFKLIWG